MSKISELSDGGALQSTDYLIAVRSGGNVKVRANGAVSGTTGQFSTSLNVDGTVTADGLTVDGDAEISGTASRLYFTETDVTDKNTRLVSSGGDFFIQTSSDDKATNTPRLSIDHATGDLSLYEDTGTTAKFFWDASAESLGIGTSSPTEELSTVGNVNIGNNDSSNPVSYLRFGATQYGAADIRPADEGGHKVGLDFYTDGTADTTVNPTLAMRITSAGNVGIGTSSPATALDVNGTVTADVLAVNSGSTGLYASFNSTNALGGYLTISSSGTVHGDIGTAAQIVSGGSASDFGINARGSRNLIFGTANVERARIDSSGNLLVGGTATNPAGSGTDGIALSSGGRINAQVSGDQHRLGRGETGDILGFYSAGSLVGSIGEKTSRLFFAQTGGSGISMSGVNLLPTDGSGAANDNTNDIGFSSFRFDDIYATNGTIQTSDRNEKENIRELLEAEARVAQTAKGLLRAFQWKDSVAEKGDEARIHFGIIAQDLQAAFEAEGLDAGRYAMFIHSTWTDEETGEERSRMGVRYSELLAFIIAAL